MCILSSSAWSCALCLAYAPTAHAFIDFFTQNKDDEILLNGLEVELKFSPEFSALTLANYDENGDAKLDKKELFIIKSAILDYIMPRQYLFSLSHFKAHEQAQQIPLRHEGSRLIFENSAMSFFMRFSTNLSLSEGSTIAAEMIDYEGFFKFILAPAKIKLPKGLSLAQNLNANIGFYEIVSKNIKNTQTSPKQIVQKPKIADESFSLLQSLNSLALEYYIKIRTHFRQAGGLWTLFVLCFIYGLAHAAAPGHSKVLISSYFGANQIGYKGAIIMALLIGFLHILSGFIIVALLYQSLQISGAKLANIGTQIGGIAIMLLAAYMIYKKLKPSHQKGCECPTCKASAKFIQQKSAIFGTNLNQAKPTGKSGLVFAKMSKPFINWTLIATASLVPCPGVLLVFGLSFEIASFKAGLVSAAGIGLGMAVLLFLAGVFGTGLRSTASKLGGGKWLFAFELASLVVMGLAGLAMASINLG